MSAPTKKLDILPAWDRRSSDPSKNYGLHGVEMRFYLVGLEGAVQFVLFTNWQLPHVTSEQRKEPISTDHARLMMQPYAADLGYHSPVPMHKDQSPMDGPCDVLGSDRCYYDGSGLMAEAAFTELLTGGHEALYRYMLKFYNDTFSTNYTSVQ